MATLSFICLCLWAVLLVSCLVTCTVGQNRQYSIPAIFAFGDANVETGNNNYIETTLKTDYPPFGETYFGQPSGRVTDGRITLDFLTTFLGLPFLVPFLQPGANFSTGINFGSGGAGALSLADYGSNRGIPLSDQLSYFQDVREGRNGSLPESIFSDALYYIQIGEVDYIELLIIAQTFPAINVLRDTLQSAVLSAIQGAVQQLYDAGGRKFLVFDVYPMGSMPLLMVAANDVNGTGVQAADDIVDAHNAALSLLVDDLRTNMSDATILLMRSDAVHYAVEADPTAYGFEATRTACCGTGLFNGETACGQGNYTLCDEPGQRIYWDQVHNTEAFFEIVAEEAWSGTQYVTPTNLRDLALSR